MTRLDHPRLPWLCAVLVLAAACLSAGQARADGKPECKRYALLVGINKYDHPEILPPLEFAENDAEGMADFLRPYGFECTVLTDLTATKAKDTSLKPTTANIQKQLDRIVKKCGAGDLFIIGFSGHGIYINKTEESYFCPQDAKPSLDAKGVDTLLSMKALYKQLDGNKASKVLLVDACRNDPEKHPGLTDKTTPTPPKNTVAMFSCSIGQASWEIDTFKHGIFFNYVLQGLKGRALNNEEGNITWDRLEEYVRREVAREAERLAIEEGGSKVRQEPTRVGEESGEPLVLIARGALGFLYDLIDQTSAGKAKLPKNNQPQVILVIPGGCGDHIGLRKGDIIMSVNGHETHTGGELNRRLGEVKVSEILELIVIRDGDKKMLSGKYEAAFSRSEVYRRITALPKDDAVALHARGWCYAVGMGVGRDENEATQWYRKAAEKDFVPSQRALGYRYLNGVGVKKDDGEAESWYRSAAAKGDAEAQRAVGWFYENGISVKKDMKEAQWWYQKAAIQDNPTAQLNLGLMAYNGKLGTPDYKEAIEWFRKSAAQDQPDSQNWLGLCYQRGHGVDRDDAEAIKWYKKAVDQGNTFAENNLGWMYAEGRGVAKDDKQAVALYRRAVAKSFAAAMSNLGFMYENGRGVDKNLEEAARLYRKAADLGNAQGQFNLAAMYLDGRFVKKDANEALRLYKKAADLGHSAAQNRLGELLLAGQVTTPDPQGAFTWFEKAAKQNHVIAQLHVATCYEKGTGVKMDTKLALDWYKKAAAQGNEEAKVAAARLEKSNTRTP